MECHEHVLGNQLNHCFVRITSRWKIIKDCLLRDRFLYLVRIVQVLALLVALFIRIVSQCLPTFASLRNISPLSHLHPLTLLSVLASRVSSCIYHQAHHSAMLDNILYHICFLCCSQYLELLHFRGQSHKCHQLVFLLRPDDE